MTRAVLDEMLARALAAEDINHLAVAVSGGSDSMALLMLAKDYASRRSIALSAVTLDHGLRPEAAEEAKTVALVCGQEGIPHETLHWNGTAAEGNIQDQARNARYRLIGEWARGEGVDLVCLGHTMDDLAETFLMRLARKSGSDGLRAMPETFVRAGARWTRPLMGARREALRERLRERGIEWIDDPSNRDMRFERVKARAALAALAPLGLGPEELFAVSANLAEENRALREAVRQTFQGKVSEAYGALSISCEDFSAAPSALSRRFLALAIRWINQESYPPRSTAITHMSQALIEGRTHTLGNVIGWVSKGAIWLAHETGLNDGRWNMCAAQRGEEIRPIGEDGLRQIDDWRGFGVPRRVLLPLPSAWQGEKLVASPLENPEKRYNTSLLCPSFNNWLSDH